MTYAMKCKKLAYNVLFSDCHINGINAWDHERIAAYMRKHYAERFDKAGRKPGTIDTVIGIVLRNMDEYCNHPWIAGTYEEIDAKLQ